MKILKDEDLCPAAIMRGAIDALEAAFRAKAAGKLVSPPRHHVSFPDRGDIVFTVGGIDGERPLAGFRAYETFAGEQHSQVVAVWRADTAELRGIILGERLGQIRTGAIGGIAIRHLSAATAPHGRHHWQRYSGANAAHCRCRRSRHKRCPRLQPKPKKLRRLR